MLPTIQQKSSLQPAIYYVVKGRLSYSKATKSELPFEEKFLHENPILARAKAFSFYQNYASILEEQMQLSCKSLPITILSSDENFGEIALEKYSNVDVSYQNPNEYDKGIAIYMVVQRPMDYMHKTDEIAERFLIHGIWNFDKSDIKNLKNGLIREFGYYQTFKYETNNYAEVIDFSVLEDKKFAYPKSELYSIISTPISWSFNYYLNENKVQLKKDRRLQNIQNRIQKGTLLNNVFLSSLNHAAIVQEIASLLNENGGFVFLGLNKFRKSVSLFEDKKFNDFKSEISVI